MRRTVLGVLFGTLGTALAFSGHRPANLKIHSAQRVVQPNIWGIIAVTSLFPEQRVASSGGETRPSFWWRAQADATNEANPPQKSKRAALSPPTPRFAQTTLTPMHRRRTSDSETRTPRENARRATGPLSTRPHAVRPTATAQAAPSATATAATAASTNSIDALEARLTSRFGTDLSQWTAQDGEYDDDDASDDTIPLIASRKVLDPWARSDAESKATVSNPQRDSGSVTEPVMPSVQSPLSAFGRVVRAPVQIPAAATAPRMNLRHLIADAPAGGAGTWQTARVPQNEPEVRPALNRRICPYVDVQHSNETVRPVSLTTLEAQRLANATAREQRRTATDDGVDAWDMAPVSWATALNETTRSDGSALTQILWRNLDRMGCTSPLATQRDASQAIRPGAVDVVIGTSTGSGKTLAVLVPVLSRLFAKVQESLVPESGDVDSESDEPQPTATSSGSSRRPLQLLVMAPGRELASQIASVARDLVQDTNWTVVLAVGGTTYTRNVQTIRQRHPQILIGSPGRLAELIVGGDTGSKKRGGGPVSIGQLDAVVLDEFDALLGESSHSDPTMAVMEYIQRKTAARANRAANSSAITPLPLQTILCSATASDMLLQPKKRLHLEQSLFLRPGYALSMAEEDTVVSSVSRKGDASLGTRMSRTIIHGVVHVPHQRMALETLRRILHTEPVPQQILVFVSDARRVNIVVDKLYEMNIIAAPLHGGMGSVKTDRAEVSKALRDGTVGLVVATEMAARGLDAPYLTHVINLDLPTDPSHYAHRAGRCGRGRRPGVVINLTTSPQERTVPAKLGNALGVSMYTVQVRNAKLNIVDPDSLDWDDLL